MKKKQQTTFNPQQRSFFHFKNRCCGTGVMSLQLKAMIFLSRRMSSLINVTWPVLVSSLPFLQIQNRLPIIIISLSEEKNKKIAYWYAAYFYSYSACKKNVVHITHECDHKNYGPRYQPIILRTTCLTGIDVIMTQTSNFDIVFTVMMCDVCTVLGGQRKKFLSTRTHIHGWLS